MSIGLGRASAIQDLIPMSTADILSDGEEAANELWRTKFAIMCALKLV